MRTIRTILISSAVLMLTLSAGCASYYKVTDPATDKSYYTQSLNRQGSGSVRFTKCATAVRSLSKTPPWSRLPNSSSKTAKTRLQRRPDPGSAVLKVDSREEPRMPRSAITLEQFPSTGGLLSPGKHRARPVYTLPVLPAGVKQRFHVMIKPVGSVCNLDCTYCYYLHKEALLNHESRPQMPDDLLEEHIRQYIEGQSGEQVVFSWQGGEPTLTGLEFFERIVELQQKYRKPFQRVENDLQTNGTLLDDNWACFLKKHGFLVGLSCDGPADLHDHYRVTKGGRPTFDKVFAAAKLLQKHKVPFNALCVINRVNAKHGKRVYRFLTRELATWRVQFIPCVEPRVFASVARSGGNRNRFQSSARPGPIRVPRTRSSPTGQSIRMTGASSSATCGMTGISATSERSSSTGLKPRWPRRAGCLPSSA